MFSFVFSSFVLNYTLYRTLKLFFTVTKRLCHRNWHFEAPVCIVPLWESSMVTALVVSVEWRLLYERCSLLGANRLRPRERLGGNYILVFLCYGASLIQYSQTHWGSLRAISKPGHFLSPLDTVAPAWFSKVLRLPQSKETHRTDFKTISGGHAKLWVFICLGLILLMCLWASLNLVFERLLSCLLWYSLCSQQMDGMLDAGGPINLTWTLHPNKNVNKQIKLKLEILVVDYGRAQHHQIADLIFPITATIIN